VMKFMTKLVCLLPTSSDDRQPTGHPVTKQITEQSQTKITLLASDDRQSRAPYGKIGDGIVPSHLPFTAPDSALGIWIRDPIRTFTARSRSSSGDVNLPSNCFQNVVLNSVADPDPQGSGSVPEA
jgi:hypothetical protein